MNFENWYDKHYDELRAEWLEQGAGISLEAWAKAKFDGREDYGGT